MKYRRTPPRCATLALPFGYTVTVAARVCGALVDLSNLNRVNAATKVALHPGRIGLAFTDLLAAIGVARS